MPASSASFAAMTLLSQEWSQRSLALVMVRPLEQFMANRPSLNLFGPYMRVECLGMPRLCLV